jgi:anti-anti-sigma factor
MPVRVVSSDDGKTLTLAVEGRFDFGLHDEFRSAYAGSHADHYIVDLAETDYIDSSALGLLVLLREHAGGDASSIEIMNCSSDVRRILKIANFHRLFWVR